MFGGLGGDEFNVGEYEYFFYYFVDFEVVGRVEVLSVEIDKWIEYYDYFIFRKSLEFVY